ncbi:oxysterol-binding protein-related protein 9-like isoform X2 [Gigantopelta aegis]|uniref:oxysterol-binding protein-related protein 9-like isoform X2 n=1 Tax=Gigantopelta aegis TaxID=1735272 RepID=UPI001B887F02|nr:oxysterol-binding protein-related protein 9-like isoform X2 [Gigantopelta aegis]
MATMEGPLSKWTNVMKGWQYRWFVLDENSGILSYYTSKDKMMRGSRRGCVRLKGAIIGIDDEDDSTFTITVDLKTFHFQARDADEREQWIAALENTVYRHSQPGKKVEPKTAASIEEFDHKLMETDAYLQILIDQIQALEARIDACPDAVEKEKYSVIKVTADGMVEAIKHAIVMMQITKGKLFPPKIESLKEPILNGTLVDLPLLTSEANFNHFDRLKPPVPSSVSSDNVCVEQGIDVVHSMGGKGTSLPNINLAAEKAHDVTENLDVKGDGLIPEVSYSSSDDEEFYDAEEHKSQQSSPQRKVSIPTDHLNENNHAGPTIIAAEDDYFDELYDEVDKEDLGSLEQHGSIIAHLLSQVRIGMDLTKVVLPTFILERRSLLEMFADFFAHPDLFVKIADLETPRERMVQVIRWYLSAFHAGRNSSVAKKPYNPIIGETFQCVWSLPETGTSKETVEDGPLPWSTKDNLAFIAEQVSHHPPISAFYAEHYNKKISLDGYIWTKSKFLGLSIGVHMIGQAVISVIGKDEEYTITFPNGYGRSILTVPWVELGGKIHIGCAKTGYSATVEFHTKPFYGGKKHRVTAKIFDPDAKNPFVTIEGEWNGVMFATYTTGQSECFVDTKTIPIIKKRVQPRDQQGDYESRRLWKDVTLYLKKKDVEKATECKHYLEKRQREEAKDRKEKGLKWETKYFHEVGEHWVYDRPLLQRLGAETSVS